MISVKSVSHSLFDSWTEESAYVLGFWLADGSIYLKKKGKRLYKVFMLHNTDNQIMEKLSLVMGQKPYEMTKREGQKICKVIYVYSGQLFDFCHDLIKSTRKSDKEVPLPSIPHALFHHFVRGFFDGDGHVGLKSYRNRHGKPTSSLVSSFTAGKHTGKFLEMLRDEIRRHIPVGMKAVVGGPTKKLVFNQHDTALLCEWMYEDSSIHMDRKKQIWDSFPKERATRSYKYFGSGKV